MYISALNVMYLYSCILYLHHVTEELFRAELFILIFLHHRPLHNKQLIVIYCQNNIVNIEWSQGTHFPFNIEMSVWDIFGILFKRVIFSVGVSSSQVILLSISLFPAIVLSQAQVLCNIFFEQWVDSNHDIILVILAVIVPLILVTVFVYLIDILITMIIAIIYGIILLEMVHNDRTSSSINIQYSIHTTQPYTSNIYFQQLQPNI